MTSKLTWSTELIPEQLGLCREILCCKTKKKNHCNFDPLSRSTYDIPSLTHKAGPQTAPYPIPKSPQTEEGPKNSDILVWGGVHYWCHVLSCTGAASNRPPQTSLWRKFYRTEWVWSGLMLARCDSSSPQLMLVLSLIPQFLKEAQSDVPPWEGPSLAHCLSHCWTCGLCPRNLHNLIGQ